ncbi:MAG: penicillin-binding transpeptidase domain-containing protein [Anaerolineales bacterium]
MIQQLHRLSLALVAGFLLIAFAGGYWGYARRDSLLGRPDNPRRILLERRIRRGAIYDRNGAVLAESVGAPGEYVRVYPYPALAPVLGYVSAFYGTAGVEAAADPVLHGDGGQEAIALWQGELLSAPAPGRDVRLSIDLRSQTAADNALGEHVGAVVVLDVVSGELLALASHPTFDANQLDEQWETLVGDPRSPLLNRTTFALYQPGSALQPLVLAASLQAGLAELEAPFPAAASEVGVGNLTFGCLAPTAEEAEITLAQAFARGCPWPFADLGGQLGADALDRLFNDFRLFEALPLAIPTAAAERSPVAAEGPIAAIGQGSLTITPLHLALATAAIARHGEMPAPQLILATQNPQHVWESEPALSHAIAAIAPDVADQVKALMPDGHRAIALTSAGGKQLAWYSGFAPFDEPRCAIAVLLEDGDTQAAHQIAHAVLSPDGPCGGIGQLR